MVVLARPQLPCLQILPRFVVLARACLRLAERSRWVYTERQECDAHAGALLTPFIAYVSLLDLLQAANRGNPGGWTSPSLRVGRVSNFTHKTM